MNDILKNNSEIQFVPRFLFEFSQDQGHIHHLLTNPANAQNCAEEMIKVVKVRKLSYQLQSRLLKIKKSFFINSRFISHEF